MQQQPVKIKYYLIYHCEIIPLFLFAATAHAEIISVLLLYSSQNMAFVNCPVVYISFKPSF